MSTVYFEDMTVGMTADYTKTFTEADTVLFVGITGDDNPVHINQEYAETTMFKSRILHGIMTAGLVSTVIGTRIPGCGAIYVSQTLRFKAPVRHGDTVTARATVKALDPEKRRVTLDTVCLVKGKIVLEGEAVVVAPTRPRS